MSDIINSSEELDNLNRGDVIASPNYMDALAVVTGSLLMNCATGAHAYLAEMPGFLPASVVYSANWAKMVTPDVAPAA